MFNNSEISQEAMVAVGPAPLPLKGHLSPAALLLDTLALKVLE